MSLSLSGHRHHHEKKKKIIKLYICIIIILIALSVVIQKLRCVCRVFCFVSLFFDDLLTAAIA